MIQQPGYLSPLQDVSNLSIETHRDFGYPLVMTNIAIFFFSPCYQWVNFMSTGPFSLAMSVSHYQRVAIFQDTSKHLMALDPLNPLPLEHLPWQRPMDVTTQIEKDLVHHARPGIQNSPKKQAPNHGKML